MKILGIYRNNGGSYHRVKLPLSHIKDHDVRIEEDITKELLDEYRPDIIYIHWTSPVSIPQLSIWQAEYKFKVVADIDDTWKLSKRYERTVFQSQNLCLFADAIICTNEYTANQAREFNDNVFIIPNYVPRQDFSRKYGDKIRIGIYGSISGHYDNWMSLKPLIKKLSRDKDIKNKICFIICGIDENKKWQEIMKVFPKDNTSLFWHEEPEDSINLVKNIDLLLCPLGNSETDKGRSNLKIYEACSMECIPVISANYLAKDIINRTLPYFTDHKVGYEIVKRLVQDSDFRKSYLNIIKVINVGLDYNIECVNKRLDVFNSVLYQPSKKYLDKINQEIEDQMLYGKNMSKPEPEIYSITYKPEQVGEYKTYMNPIKTIKDRSYLFEYNPMITLSDLSKTKGYFGVFSHKFPMKTGFYKKIVLDILENEKADVVSFCKPISNYLNWSEKQHPGLLRLLAFVCDKLNLKYKEPKNTIYSNFFVAKGDIYREYVNTIIKSAIQLMEENNYLKEMVWEDANYKSGMSPEQLKQQTGLDYYTFHTFILERLFSIWLENNPGISVSTYH